MTQDQFIVSFAFVSLHLTSFFFCFTDLVESIEIANATLPNDDDPTRSGMFVPFTLQKSKVMVTGEDGEVIHETTECTETRYMPIKYACVESIERILFELNQNSPQSTTEGYYWENVCGTCQMNPCEIFQHLPYLHEIATHLKAQGEPNRTIRYKLYRRLSNKLHGTLGRGNRVELPACLVEFIRQNFPNEDNNEPYVGFIQNSDDTLE